MLLAHMPARCDLEDLLQEVAAKMVAGIGTLRDPAKIRPWLRAIALNEARSAGRKVQVRGDVVRTLQPSDDDIRDEQAARVPEESARREEAAIVLEVARQLPPDYREPLLLRTLEGYTQREIARTLELTEAAVETRLARARRMLRERMMKRQGGERPSPRNEAR